MSLSEATRGYLQALRVGWFELGRWGRLALAGIGLSVIIAVALGFSIPRTANRHLLHGQSEILATAVEDLQSSGLVFRSSNAPGFAPTFNEAVELRLLGGDTIRVKLWSMDGTVVYSDHEDQIGESFVFNRLATRARNGTIEFGISDASEPAHALEEDLGELIEYFIPVSDEAGVFGLFEVEQHVDTLNATTSRIRRNTWFSIGVGLGLLTVFMVSLTLANAHVLTRRRRLAEKLFGELVQVQEVERRRIIGSLHDDVGQPLYRLLYGLQGSQSRLDPDHPVSEELGQLERIVRDVDSTLRSELRGLHSSLAEDLGLVAALEALVETTREETDLILDLDLDVETDDELAAIPRAALFRAAKEGITNARKHAQAEHLWLRLRTESRRVVLEVEDDGTGVTGNEGLGLTTTRERLDAIGGGLALERGAAGGTRLKAWAPRGRPT